MGIQFLINIALSLAMIIAGNKVSKKTKDKKVKILLWTIFFLVSLPSIVILILPVFYTPAWMIELKAVKGVELLTVFIGLFIGFAINETNLKNNVILNKYKKYFYMISILIIIPQYINYFPVMVNYNGFKNEWRDNVCIQSESFTCAPSCMATVHYYFGQKKTEAQMAKLLYTSRSGTSLSQIVRYARENGVGVSCKVSKELKGISAPAILDVEVSGIGHVVVFLGRSGDKFIIGDPLVGRVEISKDQLQSAYKFKGLLLEFTHI
ncbi:cysteine peptidase family C39 domain-containing protein [Pseudobacteroides cellulosolvens]|uniref:Peptidase C39 bacteriocin processing n=1 Tax=Pseudobacteroides cellulosolvens ATCC 35603 = DSM 2933 TaxID=398512 RepID=A0A0L6JLI7_9FIRM|nr:cysteine peptidase family C39 domain-containing protein [Pseudobacteroides cellulosolvens]KNY26620.1 peptidase C39 bacteriocin processing [Pseudobacteroides cellulosolvens ATCC 35603 = DSM 2933]